MTLEEKVGLLGNTARDVKRLGIPTYQWWSEALHGVGSSPGVVFEKPTPSQLFFAITVRYATSFPQVSVTSQSFDRQLFHSIASTISTEARVMNNFGHANLTYWSPNVNIYRGRHSCSNEVQIRAGVVARKPLERIPT